MTRHTLYITRLLPEPVMATIRNQYTLLTEPADRPPSPDELLHGFSQADAIIPTLAEQVDATLLAHAARLKILANYAVGYNNIDLEAANAHGIVVTNTPDVLTDATADLTWALLLAVARRIVEGDRWMRDGQWPGWTPTQMLGADVSGTTLGIVGMGRIGRAVARRAAGFGMTVLYAARDPVTPLPPELSFCLPRPLQDVLRESDYLSLHVPLTGHTRHLIGSRELALMKPSAFLLNTSRGPVVDEAALVSALKRNVIAGAGLDVYEREPSLQTGLTALPNVVLLPHLGSATPATRIRMGMICLENIAAVLNGRPAPNRVG